MAAATVPRQAGELNSWEEAKYGQVFLTPGLVPLAGGVTIYPGTMVAIVTSGTLTALPATDAANRQVLGVYKGRKLIQADGDELDMKDISRNIALMVNDTGTPVVPFDLNKQLYVVDDQTVSTAIGVNSVKAGKSRGFGLDQATGLAGVYVDFSNID